MALLAMAGFDTRHFHPEGYVTSGSVTYETVSPKRTGFASLNTVNPGTTGQAQFSFNSGDTLDTTFYIRVYLYIATLGSGGINNLLSISADTAGGTTITTCSVNSAGQISLTAWNGSTMAPVGSSPTASNTLVAGQWYRIETSIKVTSSGNDTVEMLVDGVQKIFSNTLTIGNTTAWAPNRVAFGNPGTGTNCYWDDFQINDSTGSVNNTYPGDGQILTIQPTSDVNRGSWTGGAGGTTNLFDALDNRPPTGVLAGTDTNTSQIQSLVTSTAVFGFPSYASLGIGPSNTIAGIQVIGEAGTSGSGGVTAGVEVTSNPAGPAIVQSSMVGTLQAFPTNWNRIVGTMQENPTVDRYSPIEATISCVRTSNEAHACYLALQVAVSGTLTSAGTRTNKSLSDSVTLSDTPTSVLTAGTHPKTEGWAWDWGQRLGQF